MIEANRLNYSIRTVSGINPVEAGYGLLHADTIVATVTDELIITPNSLKIELEAGGRTTGGSISGLGLNLGFHDALLRIMDNGAVLASKKIKLLLADPSCICRKFGARYGSLQYDRPVVLSRTGVETPWKNLWKTSEVSDIVVDFSDRYKFIFWKGMSYAPSWAVDNVMTSLFFAETLEVGVLRDCCEMMSDRECRYSHARVIHNSAARVVIHWRYALADPTYTICRDQWADEMFYIYPDGAICRNVTVYIDPIDESAWKIDSDTGKRLPVSMLDGLPGKRTFNDMEFISVNPMGSASEDNLRSGALTLLDCQGFETTYVWPMPPDFSKTPVPELDEYIFRMNYINRPAVFVASHASNMKMSLIGNSGMIYEAGALVNEDYWRNVKEEPSMFSNYIHWPVTRGYGTTALTDRKNFQDRPTHTFLGHACNAPVEVLASGAVTWIWLTGIAPADDNELRAKVKAWVHPVEIKGAVYDNRQRAYIVESLSGRLVLNVSSEGEIINPTFILCGWDSSMISIAVNGISLEPDSMAVGIEKLIGGNRTIVNLRRNLAPASVVVFQS
jgi:hypothetical protein